METVHEEVRNGLKIRVSQDENPDGPDAWGDNNLFLVGYHRDFTVEGPKTKAGYHIINKREAADIITGKADPEDTGVQDILAKYHVFALSAYIHSGVKLYLGDIVCAPFDTPSSQGGRGWDTSLLGAVLVAREEARTLKDAQNMAEGLVSTWNDYLSGNVYGFTIEDAQGQHIDSCWGFYGEYDKDGGALLEARAIVDARTNKGATDHNGQLLMPWAPEVAPAVK